MYPECENLQEHFEQLLHNNRRRQLLLPFSGILRAERNHRGNGIIRQRSTFDVASLHTLGKRNKIEVLLTIEIIDYSYEPPQMLWAETIQKYISPQEPIFYSVSYCCLLIMQERFVIPKLCYNFSFHS